MVFVSWYVSTTISTKPISDLFLDFVFVLILKMYI